jgi:predicted SAM-dependent methyltransferase
MILKYVYLLLDFFRKIFLFIYGRIKNIKFIFYRNIYFLKNSHTVLHLGCGRLKIRGAINCDCYPTLAADYVIDCSNLKSFKNESIDIIFSHAFIEHLYRNQLGTFLLDCNRILKKNGYLLILGIPDFEIIVKSYLKKHPGLRDRNSLFSLFNVYRYTHGDPERRLYKIKMEQLHKMIFDRIYLKELLNKAGFNNIRMFNYCYPQEIISLNLGFIAYKNNKKCSMNELKKNLKKFNYNYIKNIDEIK